MRLSALLAALTVALAPLALPAIAQAPPTPLVQIEGLRSVSPHVWVIPDNSVPLVPNVGFVVGTEAVLVVDTGLGPRNGAAVAAVAQRLAPGRTIYLVATHAHPEHDLGAQAFPPGSLMIRSHGQAAQQAADEALAQVFARRSPETAELLKDARFRPADLTFAGTHRLDLGGVTAVLAAHGPAHSDGGDISIWVETDAVLFSGDLAMQAQPSITTPNATLESWRRTLAYLEGLQPRIVVPSHGPVGDIGFVRGYRAYLDEAAERTAEARAGGGDVDSTIETVWQAMRDRYPDRARLAGAVRMAYREGSVLRSERAQNVELALGAAAHLNDARFRRKIFRREACGRRSATYLSAALRGVSSLTT